MFFKTTSTDEYSAYLIKSSPLLKYSRKFLPTMSVIGLKGLSGLLGCGCW
jgi:hypothetical protein